MMSMWRTPRLPCATASRPIAIVSRALARAEGNRVGRASLSAPESLTRGHEGTTSQVRVSGTERDTSTRALLPHTAAFGHPVLGF